MKHAGPTAIGQLEPVIAKLRKLAGMQEKKPGVFYRGSYCSRVLALSADGKSAGSFCVTFPVAAHSVPR